MSKMTGRFLALEDYQPDYYESLVIEANDSLSHYVQESLQQIADLPEQEPALEAIDNSEFDDVSDILQEAKDTLMGAAAGVKSRVQNAVSNFFSGIDRTLSRTEKLRKQIRELPKESSKDKTLEYRNKFSALRVEGRYVKDIKELTKEVERLNELGEWIIGDYHSRVEDFARAFTLSMRDKNKNRWMDKERAVEGFVEAMEEKGFPLPPESKTVKGEGKMYTTYETPGYLANSVVRTLKTDTAFLNRTKAWKRLDYILDQEMKIDTWKGNIHEIHLTIDVAKRDELLALLGAVERLTGTVKHVSNVLKNEDSHKAGILLFNSLSNMHDFFLTLALPFSFLRYVMTSLRRALLRYFLRYRTWTTTTYGDYVKLSYRVADQCNTIANKMLKEY